MNTRDDDVINQSCGARMHLKRFGYPDKVPTQPQSFVSVTKTRWQTRQEGRREGSVKEAECQLEERGT